MLTTLALAIISGISGGFICSLEIWQPVHSLYRDDDHFWEIIPKYPASYLVGGDEVYDESKSSFANIQSLLIEARKNEKGDPIKAIDILVEEIWQKECEIDQEEMTKKQCHRFLTQYVKKNHHTCETSDSAIDQIFKILDVNGDGLITK